jgi:hypothetical protein
VLEETQKVKIMELLKIFAEIIGIGMLAGAAVIVSCDVVSESERHRLMGEAVRARTAQPVARGIRR